MKCSEVKGVKSGCTVKGIYGWWSEVKWSEVKCGEVKGVKPGCTVKGIYGWWSEVSWSAVKWSEGPVKIGVLYLWINNIRN